MTAKGLAPWHQMPRCLRTVDSCGDLLASGDATDCLASNRKAVKERIVSAFAMVDRLGLELSRELGSPALLATRTQDLVNH